MLWQWVMGDVEDERVLVQEVFFEVVGPVWSSKVLEIVESLKVLG